MVPGRLTVWQRLTTRLLVGGLLFLQSGYTNNSDSAGSNRANRGRATASHQKVSQHPYLEAKIAFEQSYRESVYEQLKMYRGVVVEVNVELATETQQGTGNEYFFPKNATASIAVPDDIYYEVWRKRNPPSGDDPSLVPTNNELMEIQPSTKITIQNSIVSLLPPPGNDVYPLVTVTSFTPL